MFLTHFYMSHVYVNTYIFKSPLCLDLCDYVFTFLHISYFFLISFTFLYFFSTYLSSLQLQTYCPHLFYYMIYVLYSIFFTYQFSYMTSRSYQRLIYVRYLYFDVSWYHVFNLLNAHRFMYSIFLILIIIIKLPVLAAAPDSALSLFSSPRYLSYLLVFYTLIPHSFSLNKLSSYYILIRICSSCIIFYLIHLLTFSMIFSRFWFCFVCFSNKTLNLLTTTISCLLLSINLLSSLQLQTLNTSFPVFPR